MQNIWYTLFIFFMVTLCITLHSTLHGTWHTWSRRFGASFTCTGTVRDCRCSDTLPLYFAETWQVPEVPVLLLYYLYLSLISCNCPISWVEIEAISLAFLAGQGRLRLRKTWKISSDFLRFRQWNGWRGHLTLREDMASKVPWHGCIA